MARDRANGEASLFDNSPTGPAPATYKPLTSIWDGTDAEILELMLDFYLRRRPKQILDATVNS